MKGDRRTTVTFRAPASTRERLSAEAKRSGVPVTALITEALHIHLHRLETRGTRRRRGACPYCGGVQSTKPSTKKGTL